MKKIEYLEQKIMVAGRLCLVLLGLIFLAFAIWWAVLTIPNTWRLYLANNNGSGVQHVEGFKPDAKALDAAVRSAQIKAAGLDESAIKLREAMKLPDIAAHYDNIIRRIRAFADSKPEERARIEAQDLENGNSPLAPAGFEAVDKYASLCDSESHTVTGAEASTHCGQQTVRGIIAENLNSVLYVADNDEEEIAVHKAFVAGLDQSVSGYLDGKTPRDALFALSTAQISNTLISSYTTQLSDKLRGSYSGQARSMNREMERLSHGVTPLTVLANPFMIGTLVFLVVFVNLMMMLAVMRLGRRQSH